MSPTGTSEAAVLLIGPTETRCAVLEKAKGGGMMARLLFSKLVGTAGN